MKAYKKNKLKKKPLDELNVNQDAVIVDAIFGIGLNKKIKIPILSMPEQAYLYTRKNCKPESKIGLLSTEATIKTKVYNKYFNNNFYLVHPSKIVQKKYVNSAIKLVKQGRVKEASKAIQPAITYFKRIKCNKIILGCTELPVAVFAFKSYKFAKESKIFIVLL